MTLSRQHSRARQAFILLVSACMLLCVHAALHVSLFQIRISAGHYDMDSVSCRKVKKVIVPKRGSSCAIERERCKWSSTPVELATSCPFKHGLPLFEDYWLPQNLRKKFKNCAVVSSSAKLLGSTCGAEIDDNEVVFRVNDPPTQRFAQDVGTRTTFVTLNSHLSRALSRASDKFDRLYEQKVCESTHVYILLHDEWMRKREFGRDQEIHNRLNAHCTSPPGLVGQKILLLNHQLSAAIGMKGIYKDGSIKMFFDELLSLYGVNTSSAATSGFTTVMIAFMLCDQVSLYGFGFPVDPLQLHYFDTPTIQRKNSFHTFHEIDIEQKIMNAWAEAGFIEMLSCER